MAPHRRVFKIGVGRDCVEQVDECLSRTRRRHVSLDHGFDHFMGIGKREKPIKCFAEFPIQIREIWTQL
jgi:hypothetical protein